MRAIHAAMLMLLLLSSCISIKKERHVTMAMCSWDLLATSWDDEGITFNSKIYFELNQTSDFMRDVEHEVLFLNQWRTSYYFTMTGKDCQQRGVCISDKNLSEFNRLELICYSTKMDSDGEIFGRIFSRAPMNELQGPIWSIEVGLE